MNHIEEIDFFENPIIETEYSLQKKYKKFLKQNPDILVLDLIEPVPIYEHWVNPKTAIKHYNAKNYVEYKLTNITNAYKQFDPVIIERMLIEEAQKLKNICKGSVVTDKMCDYLIKKAKINNDTITVKPNKTIRFLTNPFYQYTEYEYKNRKKIIANIKAKYIGDKKRTNNYNLIHNAIVDFDLNKGLIKYTHLKETTNLSIATIKNYLKGYPTLKFLYEEVKDFSRNTKQKQTKKYNDAKISKKAI